MDGKNQPMDSETNFKDLEDSNNSMGIFGDAGFYNESKKEPNEPEKGLTLENKINQWNEKLSKINSFHNLIQLLIITEDNDQFSDAVDKLIKVYNNIPIKESQDYFYIDREFNNISDEYKLIYHKVDTLIHKIVDVYGVSGIDKPLIEKIKKENEGKIQEYKLLQTLISDSVTYASEAGSLIALIAGTIIEVANTKREYNKLKEEKDKSYKHVLYSGIAALGSIVGSLGTAIYGLMNKDLETTTNALTFLTLSLPMTAGLTIYNLNKTRSNEKEMNEKVNKLQEAIHYERNRGNLVHGRINYLE